MSNSSVTSKASRCNDAGPGVAALPAAPWLATLIGRIILRVARLAMVRRLLGGQCRASLPPGAEQLSVDVGEGVALAAWRLPAVAPRPDRLCVVMTHGWAEVKEVHLHRAKLLQQAGHDVVLFDLRGHGQSGGRFSSFGAMERHDVSRLIDELERRGWINGRVIGMGFSTGAALMLQHAAIDARVAGVVAFAPFYDFAEALESFRRCYGGWVGSAWLRRGVARAAAELGFQMEECSSAAAVAQLEAPVLLVAGESDRHLPPTAHVHRLAQLKRRGQCRVIQVPQAKHLSLCRRWWPGLDEQVIEFCAKLSATSPT